MFRFNSSKETARPAHRYAVLTPGRLDAKEMTAPAG